MLLCELANRHVVHTRVQHDTIGCDEPGGCDGRIKIQDRRRVVFLHCVDYEVDRVGHLGAKWLHTLFLAPHARSPPSAIPNVVNTHVPNVEL